MVKLWARFHSKQLSKTRKKKISLFTIKCSRYPRKILSTFWKLVKWLSFYRKKIVLMHFTDPTRECRSQRGHKQFLRWGIATKMKVTLTMRPFRGTRKAYVTLDETLTFRPLKAAHIKSRWFSCRVLLEVRRGRTQCGGFFEQTTVPPLRWKRRKSLGPIISRGLWGVRLFGR